MNVYPVPPSLQEQYKGCGHAIGTLDASGQINSIFYVRDILPKWDDDEPDIDLLGSDERLRRLAQALEKEFGLVIFGMVSCWEFCEL